MATSRCSVWRPKAMVFIPRDDPDATREDFETNYHSWVKGTGFCEFCGLSRKETQHKEEQHTGSLGRDIAASQADVPPMYFHGTPGVS